MVNSKNFISRARAANTTNRAVFGGRRPAAQLAKQAQVLELDV
jgi:hypothetical protein